MRPNSFSVSSIYLTFDPANFCDILSVILGWAIKIDPNNNFCATCNQNFEEELLRSNGLPHILTSIVSVLEFPLDLPLGLTSRDVL